jgi:hypothetical protein
MFSYFYVEVLVLCYLKPWQRLSSDTLVGFSLQLGLCAL